jgi:hypothetical protein
MQLLIPQTGYLWPIMDQQLQKSMHPEITFTSRIVLELISKAQSIID